MVGTWSNVLSNNRVGVLRVGYFRLIMNNYPLDGFEGVPDYVFPGANLGAPYNLPWDEGVRGRAATRCSCQRRWGRG